MNNHISQDNLALFALQLLEKDELQEALDHLEHCEECRHEVARFQGDLVGYALAQSDMQTPPAASRDRLLKAVGREKKVVPVAPVVAAAPAPVSSTVVPVASAAPAQESRTERVADGDVFLAARARRTFAEESTEEEVAPRRSGPGAFIGWAGWAVAASLAVTTGWQYRERESAQTELSAANSKADRTSASLAAAQDTLQTITDAGALQVSLHEPVGNQPQPPRPEGHAAYMADKGALVFIANHLQPLQPYKTYELWLLQPTENGVAKPPIPAGTFKPDARGIASVVMPELPKGVAATGFGVTIEDDGGSKTPTAPIVLAGMAGM